MEFHTAAWFALLGFISIVVLGGWNPKLPNEDESFDYQKVQDCIPQWELFRLCCYASIAIQAVCVLQGLHLIGTGYTFLDFSKADPETLGRAASRSRGRGGIILLIIQFFPYLMVVGYGVFVGCSIKAIQQANGNIKVLNRLGSKLQSLSGEDLPLIKKAYASLVESGKYQPFTSALGAIQGIEKARSQRSESASTSHSSSSQSERLTFASSSQRTLRDSIEPATRDPDQDLVDNLEKIESLKKRGVITDEEYAAMRRKALGL